VYLLEYKCSVYIRPIIELSCFSAEQVLNLALTQGKIAATDFGPKQATYSTSMFY